MVRHIIIERNARENDELKPLLGKDTVFTYTTNFLIHSVLFSTIKTIKAF